MNDLMMFAENVKYFRKRLGITQAQLADKLGYDTSSIGKIETGKVDIPQSKLIQLAQALECSPWDLIPIAKDNERQDKIMWYVNKLSDEYFEKLIERAEELLALSQMKEKKKEENVC